jgi:hypothetical protein
MKHPKRISSIAGLALALMLLVDSGIRAQERPEPVPAHVQTSIQDLCYAAVCWHRSQAAVPLAVLASMVTWAFADARITDEARRAGIRTIAYLDPSIQYDPRRDAAPLATDDESTYLRACDGTRARVRLGDLDGSLMDQGSPGFRTLLARFVAREVRPHYDALFADDVFAATDTFTRVIAAPCGRSFDAERDATFGAWKAAGIPIVFNGLGLAPDDGRVSDHAVAALDGPNVAGGMYEMCLTAYDEHTDHTLGHRRVDAAWRSVQNSHLAAIGHGKAFFCFAESPLDGASPAGLGDRMYTYASFLLAYEPRYSVLQEALRSAPSGVPVYPETTLVALAPLATAGGDIDTLRHGGAYVREFARCYVARAPVGACAAVVNPSSTTTVPWPLSGYRAALQLTGGSIADGGHLQFSAPVPTVLSPAGAAVVLR